MHHRFANALLIRILVFCFVFSAQRAHVHAQTSPHQAMSAAARAKAVQQFGKTPLFFERNQGQFDQGARFMARGAGYGLFLTATEAVLSLRKDRPQLQKRLPGMTELLTMQGPPVQPSSAVLRMQLVGGNAIAHVKGQAPLPGRSHYFIGNDQSQWQKDIEHFGKVKYAQVYSGIDLVYYGNQNQLEYDFLVAPGADPGCIRIRLSGAQRIEINPKGELVLYTRGGQVVQRAPVVYQEVGGERRLVQGRYKLLSAREVGFAVGEYNRQRPLVIDPIVAFSTYIGGSGNEHGNDITLDGSGNLYITGYSYSTNLPDATNALSGSNTGVQDAFVTKLSPTGVILFSTYIGGSRDEIHHGSDEGHGITVDNSGNIYISGSTGSIDLPAATNTYGGGTATEGFVSKLSNTGSILFSTYIRGTASIRGIETDTGGNLYLVGWVDSANLAAATNAYAGNADAFISKLSSTGNVLFSTYIGGSGFDVGIGITVDYFGHLYITGTTFSSNLPSATNTYSRGTSVVAESDGFVSKLSSSGSILFTTYIGGTRREACGGIIVDSSGNIYVSGVTTSIDLPAAISAYSSRDDAFVAKLNGIGSILFTTYIGGSSDDGGGVILGDGSGNLYITGSCYSTNMPAATNDAAGGRDAFVTMLSSSGGILFTTYIGGSNDEYGSSMARDSDGSLYITGYTISSNLPAATNTADSNTFPGGTRDAFVSKLIMDSAQPVALQLSINPISFNEAAGLNAALGTLTRTGDTTQALFVTLSSSSTNALVVPLSVTIPAGQTTVTFVIGAVDNTIFDGSRVVTITAAPNLEDMESATASAIVTDNEVPTLSHTAHQSTKEDTPLPLSFSFTGLQTNAAAFTLTATSSKATLVPNDATHLTFSGSGSNRILLMTPATDQNGLTTITLTASDGTNTVSDSFDLTVQPVNDAPVARDQAVTTDEDTPLPIALDASDIDSIGLTHTIVTAPIYGTLSGSGLVVTYTPQSNFHGVDSFTYRANDGALDSGLATVVVTVGSVPDAPIARADTFSVSALATQPIIAPGVLSNDLDADGDPLQAELVSNPNHGTLILSDDGAFIYTPEFGYSGPDTFTYRAHDGHAPSSAATVTLSVGAPSVDFLRLLIPQSGLVEGKTVTAQVSLSVPPQQNVTVTLSNSNPSALAVPPSVTILAGAHLASFPITVIDNAVVDGLKEAILTATAGPLSTSQKLRLLDNERALLTLRASVASFPENAVSLRQRITATLTRNTPTAAAQRVVLGSNDPGEVSVPSSIVIPAGASAVTFALTPVDDELADGAQKVTLSARADNFDSAALCPVTVTDNEKPTLTLSIAPERLSESGLARATLKRNSEITPKTAALRVAISVSTPGQLVVPQVVTIPARTGAVLFVLRGVNDGMADGPRIVTLKAIAAGFATGSAEVVVSDDASASSGLISGKMALPASLGRRPLPGIVISLYRGGTLLDRVRSASDGAYILRRLPAGSYTLSASKPGYSFSPSPRTVVLMPRIGSATQVIAAPNINFEGTPRPQLQGLVTQLNARGALVPLANATVMARGTLGSFQVRTNSRGLYFFDRLPLGTYLVAPVQRGRFFAPKARSLTLTALAPLVTGLDFEMAGSDTTMPASVVVQQPSASRFTASTQSSLSVSGVAADNRGGSGLAGVSVALGRFSTSTSTAPEAFLVWSGGHFIASDSPLQVEALAKGTTSWSVSDAAALAQLRSLPIGFYGVRATAIDQAGNSKDSSWKRFSIVSSTPTRAEEPPTPEGETATSPVRLSSAYARLEQQQLVLVFTGELDGESAQNAANYTLHINGQEVEIESLSVSRNIVIIGVPEGTLTWGRALVQWHGLRDGQGRLLENGETTIDTPE